MIISLIGYRATGKTTVARLLAERLGAPWADSDAEIERRAGKNIAQIFADEGESVFRDFEERVIFDLCQSDELILATGGGAILRENTRALLRDSGFVLWLTAPPEVILERMMADADSATMRPSLTNLPALDEIRALLQAREAFYRETATIELAVQNFSPQEIVEQIMIMGGMHE
ncbi:MAG: shikimate kinase [Planctomycetia bacterium]|nr:shikimate kinase [Planctomycetia bacterium]